MSAYGLLATTVTAGQGTEALAPEREAAAHSVADAPCKSCPYRRDVPSGVWDADEYAKLSGYDGDITAQLQAGAVGLFLCHQQDGNLCAGWLACHGGGSLLAMRLHGGTVAPEAWRYATRIPVFESGAQAAAHGIADVPHPGARAKTVIARLVRKRLDDGALAPRADPNAVPGASATEGLDHE